MDRSQLVLCLLIRKCGFKLTLHFMVGRKRVTFACFPFGIKLDQVIGDILDRAFNLFLNPFPFASPEFIKLRLFAFGTDVFLHLINLVNRYVKLVASLVVNIQVILMNAVDLQRFNP